MGKSHGDESVGYHSDPSLYTPVDTFVNLDAEDEPRDGMSTELHGD